MHPRRGGSSRVFDIAPAQRTFEGAAWARIAALCALLLVCTCPCLAAEIELILSEDSAAYREAGTTLMRELNGKALVREKALPNGEVSPSARVDLTIALGTRALTVALKAQRRPLIAGLVPRLPFDEALAGREHDGVSAVYLDQPLTRYFGLIGLVVPGRSRVGVLLSTQSAKLLDGAPADAGMLGLSLVTRTVGGSQEEIYPALAKLLAACDVLLALPDAAIYNSGTIHNILLTTFRGQQPVFGFSPAYVRAGALAAVYSTPEQIAHQLAQMAEPVLAGGTVPPPQYPRSFSVAVNQTVARSLGLAIDEAATIERRLISLERER
jgi:hypothetical protein